MVEFGTRLRPARLTVYQGNQGRKTPRIGDSPNSVGRYVTYRLKTPQTHKENCKLRLPDVTGIAYWIWFVILAAVAAIVFFVIERLEAEK